MTFSYSKCNPSTRISKINATPLIICNQGSVGLDMDRVHNSTTIFYKMDVSIVFAELDFSSSGLCVDMCVGEANVGVAGEKGGNRTVLTESDAWGTIVETAKELVSPIVAEHAVPHMALIAAKKFLEIKLSEFDIDYLFHELAMRPLADCEERLYEAEFFGDDIYKKRLYDWVIGRERRIENLCLGAFSYSAYTHNLVLESGIPELIAAYFECPYPLINSFEIMLCRADNLKYGAVSDRSIRTQAHYDPTFDPKLGAYFAAGEALWNIENHYKRGRRMDIGVLMPGDDYCSNVIAWYDYVLRSRITDVRLYESKMISFIGHLDMRAFVNVSDAFSVICKSKALLGALAHRIIAGAKIPCNYIKIPYLWNKTLPSGMYTDYFVRLNELPPSKEEVYFRKVNKLVSEDTISREREHRTIWYYTEESYTRLRRMIAEDSFDDTALCGPCINGLLDPDEKRGIYGEFMAGLLHYVEKNDAESGYCYDLLVYLVGENCPILANCTKPSGASGASGASEPGLVMNYYLDQGIDMMSTYSGWITQSPGYHLDAMRSVITDDYIKTILSSWGSIYGPRVIARIFDAMTYDSNIFTVFGKTIDIVELCKADDFVYPYGPVGVKSFCDFAMRWSVRDVLGYAFDILRKYSSDEEIKIYRLEEDGGNTSYRENVNYGCSTLHKLRVFWDRVYMAARIIDGCKAMTLPIYDFPNLDPEGVYDFNALLAYDGKIIIGTAEIDLPAGDPRRDEFCYKLYVSHRGDLQILLESDILPGAKSHLEEIINFYECRYNE